MTIHFQNQRKLIFISISRGICQTICSTNICWRGIISHWCLLLTRGKNTREQFYFSLETSYKPYSLGKIHESVKLSHLPLFDNSYEADYQRQHFPDETVL